MKRRLFLQCLFLFLLLLTCPLIFPLRGDATTSLDPSQIEIAQEKGADRLMLPILLPQDPHIFTLTDPHRIVIDLPEISLGNITPLPPFTSERISRLRIGQFTNDPPVTRIVADLATAAVVTSWEKTETGTIFRFYQAKGPVLETAKPAREIQRITLEEVDQIPQLKIIATSSIEAKVVPLPPSLPRFIIDFPNASLAILPAARRIKGAKEIKSIVAEQLNKTTVRITLELDAPHPYHQSQKEPAKTLTFLFPPVLQNITMKRVADQLSLKLDFSKPIGRYQIKMLTDPDRLIVDLPLTLFQSNLLTLIHEGPVEKIRGSQFSLDPLSSRMVVDLEAPLPFQVARSEDGLTLTLTTQLPPPGETTFSSSPNTYLKGKIIVIDPGHGGTDPGAKGASGKEEKHLNLKTALRLAKKLSQTGAIIFMTREDDSNTTLKGIVAFANQNRADLFVSVHHNAFHPNIRGTETYWHNPYSQTFAETIHKHLLQELGFKDRGCQKERFYVVRHTTMPAVLIEPGFLTNATEENLLLTEAYQERTATAVFDGIVEYLKKYAKK